MTQSDFRNGDPEPCPKQFNLARYVMAPADRTPDKTALEILGPDGIALSLTYAELRSRVLATAQGLRDFGIKPGDIVVLRLGNTPVFPVTFLAAAAIGALAVPTARDLRKAEFETLCDTFAHVAMIVTDDPDVTGLSVIGPERIWDMGHGPPAEFQDSSAQDAAYIIFTSGSSGKPKAVVHAHRAVWARRMMWQDWYGLTPDDRMLHSGALNWTYTLGTGLLDPWAIGATALVCDTTPDRTEWGALIARHRPTILATAPGILRQISEGQPTGLARACQSLRHVLSAGEGLPSAVRDAFQNASQKPIYTALGMSEISTYLSSSPTTGQRDGSGKPQSGRRIGILDRRDLVAIGEVGEIGVHRSDPGLMLGYHQRGGPPLLPLNGEWFMTGDRGVMDAEGWVTHCGRSDDVMNAGGYRVAPHEPEAVLAQHPAITEVAVAAVAVRDGVHVIAAFYSGTLTDEAVLHAFASDKLARYKQPRAYIHVEALPRRGNGKLARKELPGLWKNR